MDILKLIERDHKEVKKIFRQLEKQAEQATPETPKLVEQLMLEVKVHAKAEEATLYGALLEQGKKLKEFSQEGKIEHKLLELTLNKLSKTEPGQDGEFKAVLSVAKELFEHHAEEEEESEIFPKVEKAFNLEQRKQIGVRFLEAKEQIRLRLTGQVSSTETRPPEMTMQ